MFLSSGAQQQGGQVATDMQVEDRDTFLVESHKRHR